MHYARRAGPPLCPGFRVGHDSGAPRPPLLHSHAPPSPPRPSRKGPNYVPLRLSFGPRVPGFRVGHAPYFHAPPPPPPPLPLREEPNYWPLRASLGPGVPGLRVDQPPGLPGISRAPGENQTWTSLALAAKLGLEGFPRTAYERKYRHVYGPAP